MGRWPNEHLVRRLAGKGRWGPRTQFCRRRVATTNALDDSICRQGAHDVSPQHHVRYY